MATGATPVISSTGLFTPTDSISNAELVASYNLFADRYNAAHPDEEPLPQSSVEFIEKASGILSRHVIAKTAIVDPDILCPRYPERPNDQISIMAEIGVAACRDALERTGRDVADVDAVLCAASNMQRAYPAMAVEIQHELGMERGFAFDMNVACSSATFAIQTAADYIRSGSARSVLVVNPEITSGHLNWRDRDSHFIFGDVATAVLVEAVELAPADHWQILGTRLYTQFSNNIRNNFGFLNRAHGNAIDQEDPHSDKLFVQEGRKVFKEVVPMVAQMIVDHAAELGLAGTDLRRLWLHQANAGMNRLIAQRVLGHEASEDESPTVLDSYGNTSSAGSIIAFHKHHADFRNGETGLICSFGAGYSAGSVFVRRVEGN